VEEAKPGTHFIINQVKNQSQGTKTLTVLIHRDVLPPKKSKLSLLGTPLSRKYKEFAVGDFVGVSQPVANLRKATNCAKNDIQRIKNYHAERFINVLVETVL
jgi:hypothetical protein